mgnify:CR=1 FL=1
MNPQQIKQQTEDPYAEISLPYDFDDKTKDNVLITSGA